MVYGRWHKSRYAHTFLVETRQSSRAIRGIQLRHSESRIKHQKCKERNVDGNLERWRSWHRWPVQGQSTQMQGNWSGDSREGGVPNHHAHPHHNHTMLAIENATRIAVPAPGTPNFPSRAPFSLSEVVPLLHSTNCRKMLNVRQGAIYI